MFAQNRIGCWQFFKIETKDYNFISNLYYQGFWGEDMLQISLHHLGGPVN